MKNLHLDLVRVTEAGAIAAAQWVGRNNKEFADKVATEAMRDRLQRMDFLAEVTIGEGIKDESFGLFEGEILGCGRNPTVHYTWSPNRAAMERQNPQYSIAVDPIEGTTPVAKGGYEAMSVIALGQHGAFPKIQNFYMDKLASCVDGLNILDQVDVTLTKLSRALSKPLNHLTICLLDRPRNAVKIQKIREMGCRIKLITDCDVTACIATCREDSGIDLYMGVGGAPEAVLAAAAMKCLKGHIQAIEVDKDGLHEAGKIYLVDDLAAGPVMFCATGITDGQLLEGVRFQNRGPVTHSLTMRSESGTVREVFTEHGN